MKRKEKAILIICDGLGDLPYKGMTPLQKAHKPNIDFMAQHGINGLMYTIAPGVIPGSDTAHLAIFGYDPEKYYRGRGALEALGVGLKLSAGDVAFRCNFGTVDKRMLLTDRRAGRSETGMAEMTKALDGMEIEGVKLAFRHSVEHRAALVLSGKGLSNMVGNTDPHVKNNPVLECRPLDGSAEAKKTARIVNEFVKRSHKILDGHELNRKRVANGELPANIVVTRGAGIYERIPSLEEKHGFKSACVAGAALYKGVAAYVGMDVLDVPGATGTFNTDLKSKARVTKKALENHDFVFLHVKATDNAGHDGKYDEKVRMIEKIDAMVKELLDTDAYIILTGDHSTPAIIGGHTADPVPILVYAKEKGIRVDAVNWFDEVICARGGLGQIKGLDVMPIVAEMMGYAHIYGS